MVKLTSYREQTSDTLATAIPYIEIELYLCV